MSRDKPYQYVDASIHHVWFLQVY